MALTRFNNKLNAASMHYFGIAADNAGTVTDSANATRDFLQCDKYVLNSGVTITPVDRGVIIVAKTSIEINGTIQCNDVNAVSGGSLLGTGNAGGNPGGGGVSPHRIWSLFHFSANANTSALADQLKGFCGALGGAGGAGTGADPVAEGGGGGGGSNTGGPGAPPGGAPTTGVAGTAGARGKGGGFIILMSPNIKVSSTATLACNGGTGGAGTDDSGGGGGGAGGTIMLLGNRVFVDTSATITTTGGTGGSGGAGTAGGAGGTTYSGGSSGSPGGGTPGGASGGGGSGGFLVYHKLNP